MTDATPQGEQGLQRRMESRFKRPLRRRRLHSRKPVAARRAGRGRARVCGGEGVGPDRGGVASACCACREQAACGSEPVSYTHLTLPTNREV